MNKAHPAPVPSDDETLGGLVIEPVCDLGGNLKDLIVRYHP